MSVTSYSSANVSALYKILYPQGHVPDETYVDFPFLAMVARNEKFFGKSLWQALKYGNGNKRSSTFADAQGNTGSTLNVGFTLLRKPDYAVAQLDHESMEASESDEGALVDLFKQEVDAAFKSAVISEAQSLTGDGTGTVGAVGAISGQTITLSDINQIVNFEVGQIICAAQDASSAVRTGTGTISGVNRKTGVITYTGTITSLAVGDLLSLKGDWKAKPSGFEAWIPRIDPVSGDSFFGVDRSADPMRLAGVRDDYSAKPIEEALVLAATDMNLQGAAVDFSFLNYAKHAELENALGSKVQYVDMVSPIGIPYRGIKINTGKKPITVLADLTIPTGRNFMVQMNTWKLHSLKKSIRLLEKGGGEMLRLSNADASEVRIGGYKQIGCEAPGYNGNFAV